MWTFGSYHGKPYVVESYVVEFWLKLTRWTLLSLIFFWYLVGESGFFIGVVAPLQNCKTDW